MTPSEIIVAANALTPEKARVWLTSHALKSEEAYGEIWAALAKAEMHRRKHPRNDRPHDPNTITLEMKRDMLRMWRKGYDCAYISDRVGVSKSWVWECIKSAQRAEIGEITTAEAAEMLGVSRPTIVRWIEQGKLSAYWEGRSRIVKTADVLALEGAV